MSHLASSRILMLTIVPMLAAAPASAQSDEALEMVAEGWGRGEWVELNFVGMNPETQRFERVEGSPWTRWQVRKVGPRAVEYTTAHGDTRRVEFADGVYRDLDPSDGSTDQLQATIVEHGIHAADNWRLLIEFPPGTAPAGRAYSELIVAGDTFVWTNWVETADGDLMRVGYAISRLGSEESGER